MVETWTSNLERRLDGLNDEDESVLGRLGQEREEHAEGRDGLCRIYALPKVSEETVGVNRIVSEAYEHESER